MKLNRMRSQTSLQPDTRNGHKPSITVQFWGDKSLKMRNTSQGPGKPFTPEETIQKLTPWYKDLTPVDPVTLRTYTPVNKPKTWETKPKPTKPQVTLTQLETLFAQRRTR